MDLTYPDFDARTEPRNFTPPNLSLKVELNAPLASNHQTAIHRFDLEQTERPHIFAFLSSSFAKS